jgi:hypothetical protein
MENISLYIPYVLPHIDGATILEVFYFLEIGNVKHVDFVSKLNKRGEYYNSAFVHFHYWFDNQANKNLQERIRNPDLIARVVYDDPYFWIVHENKTEKRVPGKPKLRIDLSELTAKKLEPEFDEVVELEESGDEEPKITTAIVDAAYLAYLENEVRELREEISHFLEEKNSNVVNHGFNGVKINFDNNIRV